MLEVSLQSRIEYIVEKGLKLNKRIPIKKDLFGRMMMTTINKEMIKVYEPFSLTWSYIFKGVHEIWIKGRGIESNKRGGIHTRKDGNHEK